MKSVIDLVIRIKNGYMAKRLKITIPASKVKKQVLDLLVTKRYITSFEVVSEGPKSWYEVNLTYSEGKGAVTDVSIHSKPGSRTYVGVGEIPTVLSGLGICVLTTPQGIMTGSSAKKMGVGGELLFSIW